MDDTCYITFGLSYIIHIFPIVHSKYIKPSHSPLVGTSSSRPPDCYVLNLLTLNGGTNYDIIVTSNTPFMPA